MATPNERFAEFREWVSESDRGTSEGELPLEDTLLELLASERAKGRMEGLAERAANPKGFDREGHELRGVTALTLIDLLQAHTDTHGNTEVLVDTEDGFALTIAEARSRESYQSNPLVFVLRVDTTDEPHQLGE